jgi:putative transposase
MAKRKIRNHTAVFKFKLIQEVLQGEKTRAEIAREHDIAKSLLYKWEQVFLAKGPEIFSSTDQFQKELASRDEHIADLERMIGQLTIENKLLKKFETMPSSATHRNGS